VALHRSGEYSTGELGDLFGVGRSTVYRAVERDARRRQDESSDRARKLHNSLGERYPDIRVEAGRSISLLAR
jgi:hypothetical protein